MKAKITKAKNQNCQSFPALYEHVNYQGLIVLFFKEYVGTIVATHDESTYPLGDYCNSWDSATSKYWKRLPPRSAVSLIQE